MKKPNSMLFLNNTEHRQLLKPSQSLEMRAAFHDFGRATATLFTTLLLGERKLEGKFAQCFLIARPVLYNRDNGLQVTFVLLHEFCQGTLEVLTEGNTELDATDAWMSLYAAEQIRKLVQK